MPEPKKRKVVLGQQPREYFDGLLEKKDRKGFKKASALIAALQEDPHNPPIGNAMALWTSPNPDADEVLPYFRGAVLTLHAYSGEPGKKVDVGEVSDRLTGTMDFSSVDFLMTGSTPERPGHPKKRVRAHVSFGGPLNFDDLGIQSGPGYRKRLLGLFRPRRWWLLGLRQPVRVLRGIRWADTHWEATFVMEGEPVIVQFQMLGFRAA